MKAEITLQQIAGKTAEAYGLGIEDLQGAGRGLISSLAQSVVVLLGRKLCQAPPSVVAPVISRKSTAITVMLNAIIKKMQASEEVARKVFDIESSLKVLAGQEVGNFSETWIEESVKIVRLPLKPGKRKQLTATKESGGNGMPSEFLDSFMNMLLEHVQKRGEKVVISAPLNTLLARARMSEKEGRDLLLRLQTQGRIKISEDWSEAEVLDEDDSSDAVRGKNVAVEAGGDLGAALEKNGARLSVLVEASEKHQRVGSSPAEVVMGVVVSYYNLDLLTLKSNTEQEDYKIPRQVVAYLCRKLLGLEYTQVGAVVGQGEEWALDACSKLHSQCVLAPDFWQQVVGIESAVRKALKMEILDYSRQGWLAESQRLILGETPSPAPAPVPVQEPAETPVPVPTSVVEPEKELVGKPEPVSDIALADLADIEYEILMLRRFVGDAAERLQKLEKTFVTFRRQVTSK